MTQLTNTVLEFNVPANAVAATTVTSEGLAVPYNHDCQRMLLLIGGAEATVKAGDGLQGTTDLVVPFESGKTKALVIESGKFKFHTGENKGCVVITGTGATVQAIQLP